LGRGGRTTVPRQRTLQGALDWSYDLLSEPERTLFARLSTFAGGWTLEATEAVASDEGFGNDLVDFLSSLVEKSLVVAVGTGGGGVRYRLLEPLRQYASEKLERRGEVQALRGRHATFFFALAEEAEPAVEGRGKRPGWIDLRRSTTISGPPSLRRWSGMVTPKRG
jgi:predicted ATPase